jgi:hypothetical protein
MENNFLTHNQSMSYNIKSASHQLSLISRPNCFNLKHTAQFGTTVSGTNSTRNCLLSNQRPARLEAQF